MPSNSVNLDPQQGALAESVGSTRATEATHHVGQIPSEGLVEMPLQSPLEKKFARLRDEWKSQKRHEPSTMKTVMLPAYQKIIGMGPEVVPLLLRELESGVTNWFWALMAITEQDPVQEKDRGDGEAMARAWLSWAKGQGYSW